MSRFLGTAVAAGLVVLGGARLAALDDAALTYAGIIGLGPRLPSGHAAVTFAGATVLEQHLGWKFAVPAYVIATYVAMSRLHDNEHFLSDVVFGAATGIIVGRSVTWHGRDPSPIQPVIGPDFPGLSVEWR